MPKNSSQKGAVEISTIAAIIIIAAIVATVSIMATSKYYEGLITAQPVAVITPKLTPSATPTPVVDETANWQTYKNEEYGFEFKYPSNWKKSNIGDFFLINPNINVLQLNFIKIDSKTTILNFVNGFIEKHNCKNSDNPSSGDHIIENTSNGIYYAEFCSAGTEVYHYVTKLHDNLVLDFSYQENFENSWTETKKMEILKKVISTFNQSLSSFKLTGTNETADWKTYSNKKYGFEVKYPKIINPDPETEADLLSRKISKNDVQWGINFPFDANSRINISLWLKDGAPSMQSLLSREYRKDTIGGYDALIGREDGSASLLMEAYVYKGEYVYEIGYAGEDNIDYINFSNQLLSTFKFTK